MAGTDPNLEWLGHVQPTGLVVAPAVLARYGLVPEEQTRPESEAVAEFLSDRDTGPVLGDPWAFFQDVLGWNAGQVAGAPGGPSLPEELAARLPEAETTLVPSWAVSEPDGGWQLLVRMEATGIAPDARGALEGWEATAHQRLERLLRETGVPAGLLLTDREMRLVYAPRGETSGWLSFPLQALGTVGGRPMLGGLKLLLNAFRLFNDAQERRLPRLLKASREAQAEVSARLAIQVLGALHELLRGLHAADRARIERLAATRPEHVYEGLLTVLLRLVFLLYAEDRALIPSRSDGMARALYDEGYGVRSLHARLLGDAARYPDTMDERHGAWARLLALFRLVQRGDGSGWIRGRGGKLFDPAAFPFLQGQDEPGDAPLPAPVTDGCILRVLDGLLVLEGERLSYRTLDVEQIGSVYEVVMGFSVLTLAGPALAIRAGKNNRTPVFVDLAALGASHGTERAKFLKEEADRGQLPAKLAAALVAAADEAGLAEALRPIVDERGSPGGRPAPPRMPLLQPTDERRRTGSHYTPRTLTEPIVRHALEPAFARIGDDAGPEDILALKLCDPAMGSGAFLVEACRQIATRLVAAWARHPLTRPAIAPDEDEDLLARRLVAQRCLYGVDRNPMATDLAKLSLWLATLARDHEFTFLDHALRSGDSLVGLSTREIGVLHWDAGRAGQPLFDNYIRSEVRAAIAARREIQDAPDDITREIQETRHREIEAKIEPARKLGDAVIASFFAGEKPKEREKRRAELEMWAGGPNDVFWEKCAERAAGLARLPHPIRPFHWEIEFPEVFERQSTGFDTIVSNPPFLSGSRTSQACGAKYFEMLLSQFDGARHQCDYVAFFVRRSFELLRIGGSTGLVCTKTVAQGDTRQSGLEQILRRGASIYRVTKRIVWPGEASVIVSFVHFLNGRIRTPEIDGKRVRRISAYLVDGDLDEAPARLVSCPFFSKGSQLYGQGFTFDDDDPKANPVAAMDAVLAQPREAACVHPLFGGTDINKMPNLCPSRWAINVSHLPNERDLSYFPDIDAIIRRRVKQERERLPDNVNNHPLKKRWWAYQAHRPELYARMEQRARFLAHAEVSPYIAFRFVDCGPIYIKTVILFDVQRDGGFAALQSRVHEVWARFFASTLEDRLRYTPTDCFETFPFCAGFETDPALEAAGRAYHDHRASLMIERNEGLTKTYNRFHDPSEKSVDIATLRDLHAELDQAVLAAYGWHDLIPCAQAEFLTEESEENPKYHGRYFWPAAIRDEVLARLLALNAERAAAERARGVLPRRALTTGAAETETA